MSVSAIAPKISDLKATSASAPAATEQTAVDRSSANTQAVNNNLQTNNNLQSNQIRQPRPGDSVAISNKAAAKASNITNIVANKRKKQSTVMNHMIEQYNMQGKLRVKFVDNNNNLIYQIPPEMVAKTEDLLMKPDTSVNITV